MFCCTGNRAKPAQDMLTIDIRTFTVVALCAVRIWTGGWIRLLNYLNMGNHFQFLFLTAPTSPPLLGRWLSAARPARPVSWRTIQGLFVGICESIKKDEVEVLGQPGLGEEFFDDIVIIWYNFRYLVPPLPGNWVIKVGTCHPIWVWTAYVIWYVTYYVIAIKCVLFAQIHPQVNPVSFTIDQ